jgi:sortase A
MKRMARAARILSVALITTGLVILADAAATLAWKEPVSAVYSSLQQRGADGELERLQESLLGEQPVVVSAPGGPDPLERVGRLAKRFGPRLEARQGKPIGKIKIPSAGIDWAVVEGTDTESLRKGPGRYPDTSFPGRGRTVGIAGHRTTYGAPFRKINKISEDDRISVEMPYGTLVYRVTKTRIVEPTATQIVRDTGSERLVLTACHPLYSAAQRYAVFAELERVEPADRA